MPYIKHEDRADLVPTSVHGAMTPGELNFQITSLCCDYAERQRGMFETLNYETINAIIGVLECAKLECYRRVAAPYEDRKSRENGDVF